MAYKTYSEKLRDPRWQKRRLDIFSIHDWTCQAPNCGRKDLELAIHHLDYIPGIEPWEYPDDMLLTLCKPCHDKENGRAELEKNLSTTLKMKGFLLSDLLALSCLVDTDQKFTISLLKILRNGNI